MAVNRLLDRSGMHRERFFKATKAEVRQWIPGDGGPDEMHMVLDVIGSPLPVIMILRSPAEVDQLIRVLTEIRGAVWPKGGG